MSLQQQPCWKYGLTIVYLFKVRVKDRFVMNYCEKMKNSRQRPSRNVIPYSIRTTHPPIHQHSHTVYVNLRLVSCHIHPSKFPWSRNRSVSSWQNVKLDMKCNEKHLYFHKNIYIHLYYIHLIYVITTKLVLLYSKYKQYNSL